MLSKEQINSAMLSSLEGFSFSVVDSLEFELSRKLTASEQQEVFVIVERAVSESTSLREQLAELKALDPIGQVISCNGNKTLGWINDAPEGTLLFRAAKPAED
ncbi:hypothetical protein AB8989_13170 [Yersinia hibernica]|uniref:hypothetical protein n=1 Tax=Yersinia hibernica TaxID=2339259 RepID=UPI00197E3290|nr:hypothetical protein [Yersinia hibernica]